MKESQRGGTYLATNLEQVIVEQGRSRTWLAQRVGVGPSTITNYAKRKRTVPEHRAVRIAELLGVPLFFAFESTDRRKGKRLESNQEAA